MSRKTAIIGAGLAGVAAGDAIVLAGHKAAIYEAKPYWGGRTCSLNNDGFVFDQGPHVSFTKDSEVQDVFTRGARNVRDILLTITNAFKGQWIEHPAQCHLYGLDPILIAGCITDFVASQADPPKINNYADWCIAKFGKTFAHAFPFIYTRKYWTAEASQMSTDWISNRIYPPKLEEIVIGALRKDQKGDFHYLTECRYPANGGFQSFMSAMYRPEIVCLEHHLVFVDLNDHRLSFSNGAEIYYDHLISTIPLPDLIQAVRSEQVPSEIREATKMLFCTSLVLVDIAVDRNDLFDHHLFYSYDEDMSFSRVNFPYIISPKNAPEGKGSIQVEIYHSRNKPLPCTPDSLVGRVITELIRLNVLRNEKEILWSRYREIQYANIVFDHNRAKALGVILPWLKEHGINLAGRYAEWGYHWTDDAVVSGWNAARHVIETMKGD